MYDGSGHRHTSTSTSSACSQILEAGDLNPALRALLPAAVHSALHAIPTAAAPAGPVRGPDPDRARRGTRGERSQEIDEALFATTTCEESPFPWQRSAPPSTRLAEALGFLHSQPAADFYPFDSATALTTAWSATVPPGRMRLPRRRRGHAPERPHADPLGRAGPATPTANARGVAAQIPDAQLLVVPFTGHSVLGSDLSGCAATAVRVLRGRPVRPCARDARPVRPTPLTPTKLANVRPPGGLGGRAGKTLVAVLDTLVDLNRQVIGATLQADAELPSGSSFGGLRGGFARLTSSAAILKGSRSSPGWP